MLSNRSTRYIERVLFFLLCQKRHLYLWSTRFDHSHRSVFATCSHRMHSWLAKLILRFKIHSVTFFYCVASFFTWIESEIGCYRTYDTFTKSNVDKSQYEKNADTSIWLQKRRDRHSPQFIQLLLVYAFVALEICSYVWEFYWIYASRPPFFFSIFLHWFKRTNKATNKKSCE